MKGPGDEVRFLLTVLMAGWAMAFGYAFWALAAGLESLEALDWRSVGPPGVEFLRWQGVALLLAIAAFGVSLSWPRGAAVRGLGVLPLALAMLVGAGIGIVVALG